MISHMIFDVDSEEEGQEVSVCVVMHKLQSANQEGGVIRVIIPINSKWDDGW